jgi:hypothetical protein
MQPFEQLNVLALMAKYFRLCIVLAPSDYMSEISLFRTMLAFKTRLGGKISGRILTK